MNLRSNSGFTLVEMVIVLAVVAILSAIIVPMVSNSLDNARTARAVSDTATLGKAIVQFKQDTGVWPVRTVAGGGAALAELRGSAGTLPNNGAYSNWNNANYRLFDFHLISNTAGYSLGPSPTGMPCWNGPYISQMRNDPWSYPYLANIGNLPGGANANTALTVYVLSAGPNKATDTDFAGGAALGGDDIGFRLQ